MYIDNLAYVKYRQTMDPKWFCGSEMTNLQRLAQLLCILYCYTLFMYTVGLHRSATKEDMTKHRIQTAETLLRLCEKMSKEVGPFVTCTLSYSKNNLFLLSQLRSWFYQCHSKIVATCFIGTSKQQPHTVYRHPQIVVTYGLQAPPNSSHIQFIGTPNSSHMLFIGTPQIISTCCLQATPKQ